MIGTVPVNLSYSSRRAKRLSGGAIAVAVVLYDLFGHSFFPTDQSCCRPLSQLIVAATAATVRHTSRYIARFYSLVSNNNAQVVGVDASRNARERQWLISGGDVDVGFLVLLFLLSYVGTVIISFHIMTIHCPYTSLIMIVVVFGSCPGIFLSIQEFSCFWKIGVAQMGPTLL
jgi:hypothetical protein